MSTRATPIPAVEPVANGHAAPADLDAVLARAHRILGGDIHPDDYLPVTPEVTDAVDAIVRRLAESEGVPANEEGIRLLRNDAVLQFHHGGQMVLCRRTADGVIVLAADADQVFAVQRIIPPTERPGYVLEYPHPWSEDVL
jgi:hypothetical protein